MLKAKQRIMATCCNWKHKKDLHILQSWGYLKDLFAAFSTPCGII